MATMQGSEATLHYEQVGSGADVVWVSGGGGLWTDWVPYQMPFFEPRYRSTMFDNRGIGATTCELPLPWPLESFARDTAELIEAACEPPVALVGLSFGSAIVQQVALDRPDLLRCAIVMGTGARSVEWGWDFQEAEIEFRKAGGKLSGMMAVTHYAALQYPARVLGDRDLWPKLRAELSAWIDTGENEVSLIPQWEACLRFDQREQLATCTVPMHVLSFTEDVQAPPQDAEELVELTPTAELHTFEGMGHCSIYGHTQDVLNPYIRDLIERHA